MHVAGQAMDRRAGAKVDFEATVFHGRTKFEGSTRDATVTFRDAFFDHPTDLGETRFGRGLDLREHLTARTYAMKVSLGLVRP